MFDHLIERDLDPTGGGTYTQLVHYVWDGDNIVLAFDGHQQLIARYLNGPNTSAYDQYFTTLAEEDVASPSSQGVVTYPLLDEQGTVRDDVDANGNLIYHAVFASYGLTTYESNTTTPHLLGWQGGIQDPVTGDVLSGVRWSDLVDNFWLSQDPDGFDAGDTNLSRSRANDPTNSTDPSGLECRDDGNGTVRVYRGKTMLGGVYYGPDGSEGQRRAALIIAKKKEGYGKDFDRISVADGDADDDISDAGANALYLKDFLRRHPDAIYGQPACEPSIGDGGPRSVPKDMEGPFPIKRPLRAYPITEPSGHKHP